jgi:hypothetical protein
MIIAALLFAGGAAQAGEVVPYTLYRNSPVYPDLSQRVHIATFDAEESNAFESKTTNEVNWAGTSMFSTHSTWHRASPSRNGFNASWIRLVAYSSSGPRRPRGRDGSRKRYATP